MEVGWRSAFKLWAPKQVSGMQGHWRCELNILCKWGTFNKAALSLLQLNFNYSSKHNQFHTKYWGGRRRKGLKSFYEFKNWFLDFFLSVLSVLVSIKCLFFICLGNLWTRLGSAPKTQEKTPEKAENSVASPEEDDSELQRVWGALIKEKEQSRQKKSRLDHLPSLQIEISRESSSGSDSESWLGYSLTLQLLPLQPGRIPLAQKLDTGKDPAVKVPEVFLILFYNKRGINHLKPKAKTFVWSLWLALCSVGHCHLWLWQQTCSEL